MFRTMTVAVAVMGLARTEARSRMGLLLGPRPLAPLAGLMYSLAWRRSSMRALRVAANAEFFTDLTGKFWNWFSMIWPCTTTKRSTASACTDAWQTGSRLWDSGERDYSLSHESAGRSEEFAPQRSLPPRV